MKEIPVRRISDAMPDELQRFSIRSLEHVLNGKTINDELHRHNYFFLLVIAGGSGEHTIDFVSYPIRARSVFVLRPGQVHRLKLDQESTGFLIQFDAEFYTPLTVSGKQRFRRATSKNLCLPEINRFERMYSVLRYVFQEFNDRQEGYLDLIRANLDVFFIEFLRQSTPGQQQETEISYEQERFEEFQELVEKHVAEHQSVAEYAGMLGVSVYQLNKITKSTIGKTVSEVITDQLVLESKRNLLATSRQVKDVAYSLGFEDDSYFIRFFKKQTGFSPEAFRNRFS